MALSRREFVRRFGAGGAAAASASAIIGYGNEELLALGFDAQAQPQRAAMGADAIRISSNENLRGPSPKVIEALRQHPFKTLGLGYPRGPLAWGDAIGPSNILRILETLLGITGDPRYRPSLWLRRPAQLGLSLTHLEG